MRSSSLAHTVGTSFRVAFVCTGNRARSPFAAALLRQRSTGLPVSVESFGVVDLGPVPALQEAVRAAELLGVDLASHRARPLTTESLTDADLVLGFEQFHVATAVVEAGAAKERTCLVTELAEFLVGVRAAAPAMATTDSVPELVRSARARASSHRPIADPLGRSQHEFVLVFEDIAARVEAIASALFAV